MTNWFRIHASIFALISLAFLYILHHLPINQLFIDPFSEAIKSQDIMDVTFSKFRDHNDPSLYDSSVFIINTGITDRKKIATTLSYLGRHNARSIGVDLLFDTLYHSPADTMLRNALTSTKNIVLGYSFLEGGKAKDSKIGLHSDSFFLGNVTDAYVNLATNDGFSVRTFEPFHTVEGKEEKCFALALAALLRPDVMDVVQKRNHTKEWINFKRIQPGRQNEIYPINSGKNTHYPYVDIDRFLEDTSFYSSHYFSNKIVLLGFNGEISTSLSMRDRHFTPLNEQYTGRSLPDMHGVIIHANIISMFLDHDFIDEVPILFIYCFAFFIFLFNYVIFKRIIRKNYFFTVAIIRGIQVLQFIALFSTCVILLVYFNIKLSFLFIITAVILSFELFEFYEHRLDFRIQARLEAFFRKNEESQ